MVEWKEEESGGMATADSGTESAPFIVKLPLCKLTQVPATITTRALGMFRDKSIQVESGMMFDKEVRHCTLVCL